MLSTTFAISLLANSMISSFRSTPLVVSVNLNFLSYFSSRLLPYSTVFLTTSQFISGSPPKKSTSRFLLKPEFATRKSSDLFATSSDISALSPLYSPSPAKQYLQARLQSWAICRHNALTTVFLFLKSII